MWLYPACSLGVAEAQSCNNWERYAYGWSPDGQVIACVSFDGGRTGMWSSSATLVGGATDWRAMLGDLRPLRRRAGPSPDGRPLRCGDDKGWVSPSGGNLG